MKSDATEILRFGTFEVNLRAGEVRKQGVRVKLQEQPFQVLNILLQRPGAVVTREELRSAIWQSDTFVDFDNGLNTSINKLREALGDSADSPRFIETLPRRGYRFIAPVTGNDVQELVINAGPWKFAVQVLIGATIVVVVVGGFFWFTKRHPSSSPEFKLRQLTANSVDNPVRNGAISPDGKYLAFADRKGMYVKLIEGRETLRVAQPEGLRMEVQWQVVGWFPDGTRFLANAYPAGLPSEYLNSEGASIWVASVLGGAPKKLRDEAEASGISPDGSQISFGTKKRGFPDDELWLMDADGDRTRKLFEAEGNQSVCCLGWSPDGQRFLNLEFNAAGEPRMVSRDLNWGPPVTILPPSEVADEFVFLHDGRMIYSAPEPGAIGSTCNYWVRRIDFRTGAHIEKPKRLTNWPGFCLSSGSATSDDKRLAFVGWANHRSVYIADLEAGGTRIQNSRQLTLDESINKPMDWTADSKSVIFFSSRDGKNGLYKQRQDEDTAQLIAPLPGDFYGARVTPDNKWVVYSTDPKDAGLSEPSQLMRVPITGGKPELVFRTPYLGLPLCASAPSTLCAVAERNEDRKEVVVTAFDPVKGRGRELLRYNQGPRVDRGCDISPDGSRIAAVVGAEDPIHIFSLRGQQTQLIPAKQIHNKQFVFWAADGKGLFVTHGTKDGSELVHMDLQGNVKALWKNSWSYFPWVSQSPDGQHLAIQGASQSGNIWMMENF